ncbi:protein phosphatase 1 regulatory subunit 21 isoform X2 [Ciona intestinalis]
MADLTVKYQRLAHEYAKLKAQNQVLKKSVIESQATATDMQDLLQSKEQAIRRSQQEIESTNFRSQQMQRRVELLQLELDQLVKRGKVPGETSHPSVNSVLDEDLNNKIIENEMLHKKVQEFDMKTKQLEESLNERVEVALREARVATEGLEGVTTSYNAMKEKLERENSTLKQKLQTCEEELNVLKTQSSNRISKLTQLTENLNQDKVNLTTMVDKGIVFNDAKCQEYNAIQLCAYDKRAEVKLDNVLKQAEQLVSDICKSLSNFHKFTGKRCLLYPVDGTYQEPSVNNQKFSKLLTEEAKLIQELLAAFTQVFVNTPRSMQTKFDLKQIERAFLKYKSFFMKLCPYQLKSLKEECEISICAVSLQTKNNEYLLQYKRLFPAICKAHTYFHIFAVKGEKLNLSNEKLKSCLCKLVSAFTDLHLTFRDLSKAFNGKIEFEYELPTTTNSNELRSTNEILLSSMISLSSNFARLSGFLNEHQDFFVWKLQLSSASSVDVKRHALDYMRHIKVTTLPQSVPYLEAIKNHHNVVCSSENRDELLSQLEKTSSKLHSLEQEKEHWLLETQLMKVKLEKMKVQATNTPITNGVKETRTRTESVSFSPTDVSMSDDLTEDLIKQHLTVRITEMGYKMQHAEAKTLHFESECNVLHKHLGMAQTKQSTMQHEISSSLQKISQLQDELSVTRRNYEDQLSLMSEHLASMNDKLASQKDEIENLKVKKTKKLKMPSLH